MTRVLCLLRNIRTRLKTCGEGGLDVATAATNSVASTDTIDLPRTVQEKTEATSSSSTNVQTTNMNSTKSGNSATTSNITSGVNLLQQRNIDEKAVFASLAKTAGAMLTNTIVRK